MTTTSIKDVGNAMNLGVAAVGNVNKTVDGAFQSVWNNQTGKNQTSNKEVNRNQPSEKASKPGDALRAKDARCSDVRKDAAQPTGENSDLTAEQLEEAAEKISAAVADLVQAISETFGIPVEEVEQLILESNLQPVELLQPENLGSLLMQVSGAEDSLALLTDEALYQDFKAVMAQGSEALEEVSAELGVPTQELPTVFSEVSADEEEMTPATNDEMGQEAVFQVAEKVPDGADEAQKARQDDAHSRRQGEHEREPHENLMLQGIREERFGVQTEGVQEMPEQFTPETREIMNQIMDYMRVQVKADVSSMEMQLHPASLGTLQIQVASKGGVLTANFITQNEAVKAALESQMVQLKESFAQQGVKVEAIEVTVQTHEFEQNLEQGRGRQPQETDERRARTRRIQLNGLEEPEELEPEEQIVAEMMAANGNTVDYTA